MGKEYKNAVLVGVYGVGGKDDFSEEMESLEELDFLAETLDISVVDKVVQKRAKISAAYYIGKGKIEEIIERQDEDEIGLIIFDNDLKPLQVRNLEKLFKGPVIDRTELILQIFAFRARTKQAKLQVQSAQLKYEMPRLKRMWTHFTKIEGGIGMRGMGETQLEVDKRRVRKKIQIIDKKLQELEKKRGVERKGRQGIFNVSLVGYTNAGKSTLLKALSGADVFIEDKLFATLDAVTRRVNIDKNKQFLVTDTVGFIKKLSHDLVASFHATLSEINYSDLLLHIVDISSLKYIQDIVIVLDTLKQIGSKDKEKIFVFNKIDKIDNKKEVMDKLLHDYGDSCCFISAKTGFGISKLKNKINTFMDKGHVKKEIKIKAENGKAIAFLRTHTNIIEESFIGDEFVYKIITDEVIFKKIEKLID